MPFRVGRSELSQVPISHHGRASRHYATLTEPNSSVDPGLDVDGVQLRYVRDSTVQFDVYERGSGDDDDDSTTGSVPFQVAYAVSIHKAQGLEYDSVKVVITDANEDDISHNIFYTAITRAREYLQIFWTPETEHAVLSSLRPNVNKKDAALLMARRGLAPMP
mgnify:CR=1 FL=1